MAFISMILGFFVAFYWIEYLKKELKLKELPLLYTVGIFVFSSLFGVFSVLLAIVSWIMRSK